VAQVVAVEPEDVEDVVGDAHAGVVPALLQRLEARLAAHDPDDLAVDNEPAARVVLERCDDLGVALVE
jgi:hypothetical protein